MGGLWGQVWPNLLANALWVSPAFVVHHVLMRRHSSREHSRTRAYLAELLGNDIEQGAS